MNAATATTPSPTPTAWQRGWSRATGRAITDKTIAVWIDTLAQAGGLVEGDRVPYVKRPKWSAAACDDRKILNLEIRYLTRCLFGCTLLTWPVLLRVAPRDYTSADMAPVWRSVEQVVTGDLDAELVVSCLMDRLATFEALKGAPHAAASQLEFYQRVWVV